MTELDSILETLADAAIQTKLDDDTDDAYRANRLVPHVQVREWLVRLARGEPMPQLYA